jgi:hypothetical protein
VYIETVSSNSHEMSSILLSWHDEQLTGKVVLNYKKPGRSPKITKLVDELCYHMYRLCARLEKILSKLRRLMPTTHTSPGVLSHGSHVDMSGFQASHITTCSKSSQLLHTTSTCDNTMSRQVLYFSDFVRIFCNLETLSRMFLVMLRQQDARYFMWVGG